MVDFKWPLTLGPACLHWGVAFISHNLKSGLALWPLQSRECGGSDALPIPDPSLWKAQQLSFSDAASSCSYVGEEKKLSFYPPTFSLPQQDAPCVTKHRSTGQKQTDMYWHVHHAWASLVAQTVKNLPEMQGTQVWSLGWEDALVKEMATHSSILAWRSPWTEEAGGLQSMKSQRVGHNWAINTFTPERTQRWVNQRSG